MKVKVALQNKLPFAGRPMVANLSDEKALKDRWIINKPRSPILLIEKAEKVEISLTSMVIFLHHNLRSIQKKEDAALRVSKEAAFYEQNLVSG